MSVLLVEDALARVTANIAPLASEEVNLLDAANRVLAEDVKAKLTQPPFAASAMDGYAVKAEDVKSAPVTLKVIGEAAAGHAFIGALQRGEAVRIFTGAPLPVGADAIIIQENTRRDDESTITILQGETTADYIRPQGMDFSKGEALLKKGYRLTARDVSLAAAMNHENLSVCRQPRVAILATGDELVRPGESPNPDQIISSIPYGLTALIEKAGGRAKLLGIAQDTEESLDEAIGRGMTCDILVTIGGASVGDHDLVQQALINRGMALDFWKIAMRPGKPLMYGRLNNQYVLGVPGNPVSAFVCARIFLVPVIHRLLNLMETADPIRKAVTSEPLERNGPRQHYMRAVLDQSGDKNTPTVTPLPCQDSSLLSVLARANCLIIRAPDTPELPAGSEVSVMPLDF